MSEGKEEGDQSPDKSNRSVGVYASALRGMLRRMSLGDGEVSLDSLDQVIAIGKNIVDGGKSGERGVPSSKLRKSQVPGISKK